jgi:hypothetical protein
MGIKRYWLRGGATLLTIGIVCTIVAYFGNWSEGSLWQWLFLITIMPFAFGAFFVGGKGAILTGLAAQYVLYFAIGSAIGWIYGKLRGSKVSAQIR